MVLRTRSRKWLGIALAAAVAPALLAAAHWISPLLPGAAGEVFRQNVSHDIEATALIYSESGDIRDYLDPEKGRYRTSR
jgi:hypothetical protein